VSSAFGQSFQGIGDLPGGDVNSSAYGVGGSSNNPIVVGASSSTASGGGIFGYEAVRWQSGTLTPLGNLPSGGRSLAAAVSDDGAVIVGLENAGLSEAF